MNHKTAEEEYIYQECWWGTKIEHNWVRAHKLQCHVSNWSFFRSLIPNIAPDFRSDPNLGLKICINRTKLICSWKWSRMLKSDTIFGLRDSGNSYFETAHFLKPIRFCLEQPNMLQWWIALSLYSCSMNFSPFPFNKGCILRYSETTYSWFTVLSSHSHFMTRPLNPQYQECYLWNRIDVGRIVALIQLNTVIRFED